MNYQDQIISKLEELNLDIDNFDIDAMVAEAEDYFFENDCSTAEIRYDGLKFITVERVGRPGEITMRKGNHTISGVTATELYNEAVATNLHMSEDFDSAEDEAMRWDSVGDMAEWLEQSNGWKRA